MLKKILTTLIKIYSLPFEDIKLHRDMVGYVCIVLLGNEKFVLKLFQSKHDSQAMQSIEIMKYLYEAGYPTPYIIPTSGGMSYFTFDFQEESRIGVLYEFIDGIEPDKRKDIENIGKHTGKLHSLMQQYNGNLCSHSKPYFIDRYTTVLSKMNYPSVDKFVNHGNMLWKRVEGLPNGFCHGDYHTGNMLLTNKGKYKLYDFDASANAFPVYDIAIICDMTDYFTLSEEKYNETAQLLERFLKGYTEYNSISKEEITFVYDFIAIRHFEVQATIIENLGLLCVNEKFIDNQYDWLMQWDKLCKNIK